MLKQKVFFEFSVLTAVHTVGSLGLQRERGEKRLESCSSSVHEFFDFVERNYCFQEKFMLDWIENKSRIVSIPNSKEFPNL